MAAQTGSDSGPSQLAPLELGPDKADEEGGTAAETSRQPAVRGETGAGSEASEGGESSGDTAGTSGSISGVEVNRLDTLDPEAVGILDPSAGGLGPSMWGETPRHLVTHLLPQIPRTITSPALRDLARRLLLSSSAPPRAQQAAGANVPSLLSIRAKRLMALGYTAEAAELLRVVPRRAQTDILRRIRMTAELLSGTPREACTTVANAVRRSDAVFWQRAKVICHLVKGERTQADLTVSLMRELSGSDSGFVNAYDAVTSGGQVPEGSLSRLSAALLRQGEVSFPASVTRWADPDISRVVALHEATDLATRIAAAEVATAAKVLQAAELRRLYQAAAFPDQLIQAAIEQRLNPAPPATGWMTPGERRALRYQAILSDSTPAARTVLLDKVLASVTADLYPAVARAFMPLLLSNAPRPDLVWFAGQAGRAFYSVGRAEAAAPWLKLAREEAMITPEASRMLTVLWPYARLSGGTAVAMHGGLATWRGAQDASDVRVAHREVLLRTAFAALAEQETRTWLSLVETDLVSAQTLPSAALVYALQDAGRQGRVGEVVLLSVLGLGQTGLADAHPVMLGTALSALSRVGLAPVARSLAIEAIRLNGV